MSLRNIQEHGRPLCRHLPTPEPAKKPESQKARNLRSRSTWLLIGFHSHQNTLKEKSHDFKWPWPRAVLEGNPFSALSHSTGIGITYGRGWSRPIRGPEENSTMTTTSKRFVKK
ncbi:hypothetical protein CIRG_01775 [Coccidioides immitis RMSCC 2394]|uniref:Uncharacterized protein n=1 Tax=Coccidioides immitis RMSCC 2394 TaxID=404692 RepID=A0A0J6XZA3_COCIT|nr:hypothetical protein CIRG_01775 [Coccidioides immitis RMSCC 2394]